MSSCQVRLRIIRTCSLRLPKNETEARYLTDLLIGFSPESST
jgi:hypothetical protein